MEQNNNGWTPESERLLQNWSKQIIINEKEHRKRGVKYGNIYFGLGILLGIIQSISVAALCNYLIGEGKTDSIVLSTILESISLIAQIFDRFYNFGSSSEKHFDASKEFNALARLIDGTLTLGRNDRDNAREFVLSVRQQFDSVQDGSPNLPNNSIIHKLELCIYNDPEQAKGIRGVGVVNLNDSQSFSPEASPPGANEADIETVDINPDGTDDNHISNSYRRKFAGSLVRNKSLTKLDGVKKKNVMSGLNYQLERMNQHEEEQKDPPISTSSDNDSVV